MKSRHSVGDRWLTGEIYVKVVGVWRYVYRAVDQHGQVIDVYLSRRRDIASARYFFTSALRVHRTPSEVITDRAPALANVIEELIQAAFHNTGQYANNRCLAVNGSFDHRRGSVDSITSEVESWRVLAPNRTRPLGQAAVQMCADAIMHVRPPGGISSGLSDKLNWTVNQLVAGSEIGTSP
ncbi:MAG: hypothetical protein CK552_03960 [Actinobacteria bacterium]|nr:MAG: hypothetical protein CK552_03960 [Actinomycetota bacterium]